MREKKGGPTTRFPGDILAPRHGTKRLFLRGISRVYQIGLLLGSAAGWPASRLVRHDHGFSDDGRLTGLVACGLSLRGQPAVGPSSFAVLIPSNSRNALRKAPLLSLVTKVTNSHLHQDPGTGVSRGAVLPLFKPGRYRMSFGSSGSTRALRRDARDQFSGLGPRLPAAKRIADLQQQSRDGQENDFQVQPP